jgi:AraC-like DNA-binding protein
MTITLTDQECDELWAEAEQSKQQNPESDKFLDQVPQQIGTGYVRSTEVHPYLWLQIITCSYTGVMKRMFLQVKTLEMIALQLVPIITDKGGLQPQPRFRAGTVERIHQAREILLSRLDNPPALLELAQLVGVSDRTLQRGFQRLFGTTVFGYLTDKRMEQAERWLREGNRSVLEVAIMTGYSNPTHFSVAFKRKFGISPSQCFLGKKSV